MVCTADCHSIGNAVFGASTSCGSCPFSKWCFLVEAPQELSQVSSDDNDCFQFPKIQHQCGAWDNAALGFGVPDSAVLINLFFATYVLKPFQFLHSPLPTFFSSYHSRAPPVIN